MEREIGEARLTGAFGMKVAEFETPAIGLPAGMFARDPITPALNAAGEPEVDRIYRQHAPAIENTLVEPVGPHEYHALATARSCRWESSRRVKASDRQFRCRWRGSH